MPDERLDRLAQAAYEANREAITNRIFRPWKELIHAEKDAWRAAATAVIREAAKPDDDVTP